MYTITLNSYIYLIKCKISACQWRQTDTVIKRKHEKNIKSLCSKPPRWNVNRGLHQMKRCEACLWRAIQDNKKYQEKKSRCYPLPWKRRVISTECCSEKSGEEEGAWFCLCGMLACFQEMGNERRMRRTWSSLRAAGFRCPCRPERGGANFHCLIWLRNHQLAFLEERSGQIFSLLLYPAPPTPPPPFLSWSLAACLYRDCEWKAGFSCWSGSCCLQSPMYYGCVCPSVGHVTFSLTNVISDKEGARLCFPALDIKGWATKVSALLGLAVLTFQSMSNVWYLTSTSLKRQDVLM